MTKYFLCLLLLSNKMIAQIKPGAINQLPIKTNPASTILLNSNWNFELGNLTGWVANGNAFSNQPVTGAIHPKKSNKKAVACWNGTVPAIVETSWNHGLQGNYWASSGENRNAAAMPLNENYINNTTGYLLSKNFTTNNHFITFLLAGKSAQKKCSVDILALNDGTVPGSDTVTRFGNEQVINGRVVKLPIKVFINFPSITIEGKNYFIIHSIVNTTDVENDVVFTNDAGAVQGLQSNTFKRVYVPLNPKFKGKNLALKITDNDVAGYISVDDIRFENTVSPQPIAQALSFTECPLQGIVDLHTHPMSYLGFGRKAVHGLPDIGSLVPAGTYNCNPAPIRATSIEQALGSCNSTHGGFGLHDNTCGDYLRSAIINYALDGSFKYNVAFERNPHGDHEHAGYPDLKYWPHQTSILHQQMWVDWLRRAHKGGIKTIVALTVNNELLANITNGDAPYDDKTVADVQIAEMKAFAARHNDFMEIAYSPADIRRIVRAGKLAVILGMEIDKIGNFGKPGVVTNETTVREEIRRLYRNGIRYAFPVHLIDNSFGGTAVYSMLFNFANKQANGYHFNVTTATDPNIRYKADFTIDNNMTPPGFENASIMGIKAVLELHGELPGCVNASSPECLLPPGKAKCCGSYQRILNVLQPSPELDAYKLIPGGHMNNNGLTTLGEIAINEMMKTGMMIDVDHMGEKSLTRAIDIADAIPGDYPLMMGHNEIRGSNVHTMKERSAPANLVTRLAALGGMFGVGTTNTTPEEFITNNENAANLMANTNMAIGTDVNGFERLPTYGQSPLPLWQRAANVNEFSRTLGVCTTGNKTWNYINDGGVSHYGMMPEFFWDVKNYPKGSTVMNRLENGVENLIQLWEKIERVKTAVR